MPVVGTSACIVVRQPPPYPYWGLERGNLTIQSRLDYCKQHRRVRDWREGGMGGEAYSFVARLRDLTIWTPHPFRDGGSTIPTRRSPNILDGAQYVFSTYCIAQERGRGMIGVAVRTTRRRAVRRRARHGPARFAGRPHCTYCTQAVVVWAQLDTDNFTLQSYRQDLYTCIQEVCARKTPGAAWRER